MTIKPLNDFVFLNMKKIETNEHGFILVGTEEYELTVEVGGDLPKGTVVHVSKNNPSERVTIKGKEYLVIDKKYIFCTL